MKLIKLDRRHNLYHYGYQWAFAGERWSNRCQDIEKAITELEGRDWNRTFWGKYRMHSRLGYAARIYYIGVKKESTATMVLLKI